MFHHLVGRAHQPQRLPRVPQLPTRLLATPLALAARPLAPQRIGRGRFAAVVAVFGQPRFQLLHPCEQLRHLLLGVLVERVDVRVLCFQFSDALVSSVHALMLRLLCKPA